MRAFRDEELINRVESLPSFKGWVDGVYDIWVRAKRTEGNYDRFCDKVFTYKVKDGIPKFIQVCTGTSTAGSYGLLRFFDYNKLGCAVLDGDQIIYGFQAFGYHKHIHDAEHEAYVQIKGASYHRDNDKDHIAEDTLGEAYNDIIGANSHHAGWLSLWIKNWSVACLVRNVRTQFNKWLSFMKSEGKPRLNVAILNEF